MPKRINMLNTSNIQNSNFANNLSNNSSIVALKNDLSNKTAEITKLQNKYNDLITQLYVSGDIKLSDISNNLVSLKFP